MLYCGHGWFSLLDLSHLQKYDSKSMYAVYDNWPQMAQRAYTNPKIKSVEFTGIDHIVFAGMGGSGAIGDLFSSILSKDNIHVSLVKGYLLPRTVDSHTLVVVTSVSGNTSETLVVLESALKLDCKIIAFSNGGKIELFCNENNILFQKIPIVHSARASYLVYVYSILKALTSVLPITDLEIKESIEELVNLSKKIGSFNMNDSNLSIHLANCISGIPIIYYPSGLQAAAVRFKNSLQENAKTHVIVEDIIEMSHNGIVSWEKSSNVQPILLQGTDDYIKTKERWKILKDYFKTHNISFLEIHSINGNILSKLICFVYLLDFTSIYYAVKTKTDPSPVDSIDYMKEKL